MRGNRMRCATAPPMYAAIKTKPSDNVARASTGTCAPVERAIRSNIAVMMKVTASNSHCMTAQNTADSAG